MLGWLTGSSSRRPAFLKLRSSKTFIIVTVSTAVFTDMFVYGIVVPVLPFALTERSNIDSGSVQTWISIFLAVYGAALLFAAPICGWFADRSSSRRMPLMLGLLALGGSTAMLCVGDSIGILAAGRVLQGISAAVVWVVGLALLVDTVGPDGIGQAMGYVGMSMSLAILLAPLLGGIVFDLAGYYAVFAMAFGLIALDIVLRLVMIEKKYAAKWLSPTEINESIPPPIETTKTTQEADRQVDREADLDVDTEPIEPIHVALNNGPPLENLHSHKSCEQRQEQNSSTRKRIINRLPAAIYLLSSRRVLSAIWCCMIQAAFFTSFDSILPLFVRDTFNWDSLGAGLIFLPIVIVSFLGPLVGWACDKVGPRWFATAGFTACCPFLILLRLVHDNTLPQKVLLCALLALFGLTQTVVLTPMMAEITYSVDAKAQTRPPGFFGKNGAYAQAYSLFNMAWAAGSMVGPLLAGLVNQRAGWGVTTMILGIVSIMTAIPAVIWTGGSLRKESGRKREIRH
ncbi:MFS general substrate transporter [Hortaea werneckii]|nr:MFS general substrate transporter [Hortaea werneckii]KAI7101931.1 MFS general substrate transporter [Hortaea werneckii]KAI7227260.1 MFS general substrate transporter [Hortaea werneckii]KAI7330379.1 MFS general substrate transporter [Hortaea werneckii]KAI7392198.1 MFS general substrate transporter [Hortaea werneckii]